MTADFRTPCSTDEEDSKGDVSAGMAHSSSRELLSIASDAARHIGDIIKSPIAKLNKAESASVTQDLATMMEVVSHLAIALVEVEPGGTS